MIVSIKAPCAGIRPCLQNKTTISVAMETSIVNVIFPIRYDSSRYMFSEINNTTQIHHLMPVIVDKSESKLSLNYLNNPTITKLLHFLPRYIMQCIRKSSIACLKLENVFFQKN